MWRDRVDSGATLSGVSGQDGSGKVTALTTGRELVALDTQARRGLGLGRERQTLEGAATRLPCPDEPRPASLGIDLPRLAAPCPACPAAPLRADRDLGDKGAAAGLLRGV